MSVVIREIGESELRLFINYPRSIYKSDPNWVPPIYLVEKALLTRKNPFFEHSVAHYFIAFKDSTPVGRIAAIRNGMHNKHYNDKMGFFGFFECVDDVQVASKLFESVEAALRKMQLDACRGPMSFSTNDVCGLLIEGFDTPPYIMMSHNPPYYDNLITKCGYKKTMDLLAFLITKDDVTFDRFKVIDEYVTKKIGVKYRKANMKEFSTEIGIILDIYQDAWSENWGFVPMTSSEIEFLANSLKPIIDPNVAIIAEIDDRPVGFTVGLPNINELVKKIDGRLFPFGWLTFRLGLKKLKSLRTALLGVRKEYQAKYGLGPILLMKLAQEAIAHGYYCAEMSWILETNQLMIKNALNAGAKFYKKYRIYDKTLTFVENKI